MPSNPLYSSARWRRLRRIFLTEHPLCVMCEADGYVCSATVVDHIRTHKNDPTLFWDLKNLQALCKSHHDSTKQRQDKTGRVIGFDVDGTPLDPDHAWHKR